MKYFCVGYKTLSKTDKAELVYMGSCGDELEAEMKKSKMYRIEVFQGQVPTRRKFKEENAPTREKKPVEPIKVEPDDKKSAPPEEKKSVAKGK